MPQTVGICRAMLQMFRDDIRVHLVNLQRPSASGTESNTIRLHVARCRFGHSQPSGVLLGSEDRTKLLDLPLEDRLLLWLRTAAALRGGNGFRGFFQETRGRSNVGLGGSSMAGPAADSLFAVRERLVELIDDPHHPAGHVLPRVVVAREVSLNVTIGTLYA